MISRSKHKMTDFLTKLRTTKCKQVYPHILRQSFQNIAMQGMPTLNNVFYNCNYEILMFKVVTCVYLVVFWSHHLSKKLKLHFTNFKLACPKQCFHGCEYAWVVVYTHTHFNRLLSNYAYLKITQSSFIWYI